MKLVSRIKNKVIGKLFNTFELVGIHLLPVHFYSPIPDTNKLKDNKKIWGEKFKLHGINMNSKKQLSLMNKICKGYRAEYSRFLLNKPKDPTEYYLNNTSFGFASGQMHYGIIRYYKPKNVIEIGSGMSTLVTCKALTENNKETGHKATFTAIEPFPPDYLHDIKYSNFKLIKENAENIDTQTFRILNKDDLLFIDSTHVSKINSDVNHLMFDVIPQLRKGVIVHIHDIHFPFDYFKEYILNQHFFWNEQYLVQAFLMYNSAFEVLWCGSYMSNKHPKLMAKHFPAFTRNRIPTSLYIRKIR